MEDVSGRVITRTHRSPVASYVQKVFKVVYKGQSRLYMETRGGEAVTEMTEVKTEDEPVQRAVDRYWPLRLRVNRPHSAATTGTSPILDHSRCPEPWTRSCKIHSIKIHTGNTQQIDSIDSSASALLRDSICNHRILAG